MDLEEEILKMRQEIFRKFENLNTQRKELIEILDYFINKKTKKNYSKVLNNLKEIYLSSEKYTQSKPIEDLHKFSKRYLECISEYDLIPNYISNLDGNEKVDFMKLIDFYRDIFAINKGLEKKVRVYLEYCEVKIKKNTILYFFLTALVLSVMSGASKQYSSFYNFLVIIFLLYPLFRLIEFNLID